LFRRISTIQPGSAFVPEFVLKQKTGLGEDGPHAADWPGFTVREVVGEQVFWAGVTVDGKAAFDDALRAGFGCVAPAANRFTSGKAAGEAWHFISAGPRQVFIVAPMGSSVSALETVAALTDQTDGWISIRMEGEAAREVLSRLCGVDFHPAVFQAGHSARAPFEGMLAVVCCEDVAAGSYRVLFQRSSARSFVAHVAHAATSVCGPSTSGGH
jgi:sarcosine oxidase subunit gamma